MKTRLTDADNRLIQMLENLTRKKCEPLFKKDRYQLLIPYPDEKTAEAYKNAIAGRLGERLLDISTDDKKRLIRAEIAYSGDLQRLVKHTEPVPSAGQLYCKILGEVRALQVDREDTARMLAFVGSGQFDLYEGIGVLSFIDDKGIWRTAQEGDYIVLMPNGNWEIIEKKEFESNYERK